WPDGRTQRLFNLQAGQKITVNYSDAHEVTILSQQQAKKKIFSLRKGLINYVNEEDNYNDFKRQPLIPNMISHCGPRCAKSDVNNDGLEDLYFCGAKDVAGKIFIQAANGIFTESNQPAISNDSAFDDADAIFFDQDGDGDKDLYVVSGGYH